MFADKVLLEPVTHIGLWLLSHYNSRAEYLQQRPSGPQSLEYLLSGPLQEKFVGQQVEAGFLELPACKL